MELVSRSRKPYSWSPPDIGILEISGHGHSALESQLKSNTEGFPSGSAVKNLPVMQEIRLQSLGHEDPPEKEMATHSSILSFPGHPMDRGARWATAHGVAKELDRTEHLKSNIQTSLQ